jgi:phosphoribosyl 1,2-cyclic phosphodiesterase
MELTFWGVRGSIPVPGPDTVEFGGDTMCLDISDGESESDGRHYRAVLDAGTGITNLGRNLLAGPAGKGAGEIHIFLTHTHWDHIQGFPYFIPGFIPGNRVVFWGRPVSERSVRELLEGQMKAEYNPIYALDNMGSTIEVNEMGSDPVTFGTFTMETIILPHKGSSSLGFKISDNSKSVAFLGDVDYGDTGLTDEIVAFADGADVLIHDVGDQDAKGSVQHIGVELAKRIGARQLLFTHFAPWQTDTVVHEIIESIRKGSGTSIQIDAARQGMQIAV